MRYRAFLKGVIRRRKGESEIPMTAISRGVVLNKN